MSKAVPGPPELSTKDGKPFKVKSIIFQLLSQKSVLPRRGRIKKYCMGEATGGF